ncbi:MAG: hypothetical protein J6L82_03365 [Alphaproteobacteria bacterium]|nr:hypothetical protein [Alphaproteobacteria bacterium]
MTQQQPSADFDNPDGQAPLTESASDVSIPVLLPIPFDEATHHLVPFRAKVDPGFVEVSVYPELQVTLVPLQVPFSGHCVQVGTALLVPLNVMVSSVF